MSGYHKYSKPDCDNRYILKAPSNCLTGTPSGVGVLQAGDQLKLKLGAHEWVSQVQ
ncbi:hypothetical protein [Psychrobacter sp. B29-1]|uniref:hypothetical protein n=1 Tax=Psychrobacter sp. B29-1 TaxID=1867800 RepID=UPI0025E513D4|nr:hypothetical protein [Psychrobacter sp. B29-1]